MTQQTFRPALTPKYVAEALGQILAEAPRIDRFTSVTTDSRKAGEGALFVAIPGDRFDGHEFIERAVASGAKGVICRKDFPLPASVSESAQLYRVDDPVHAYRKLGAAWRREFSIPMVAVAGSVGKTTTKELLAALLQGRWPEVLKTQGSQNGFVGIPMTLLDLDPSHGAAVIEVGIDEIGAMEKHMEVVRANASLLTAIGPEHLEKLRDVPTVAREEGIALSAVAQTGGTVAINLDDPWIRPFAAILKSGKKVLYTLKDSEVPASAPDSGNLIRGKINADGSQLELRGMGLDGLKLHLPLLGLHNASNLLGAVAIAHGIGLSREEIGRGLATFKGAEGRSELRELAGGTPVLCDYYNANPTSVEAGLELLSQLARGRARWACLADMLELGPDEERFHRDLSGRIVALNLENLLLFGPRMKALEAELKEQRFAGTVRHFDSHAALAGYLLSHVSAGDAILIKGSRGMRMEEVWKIFSSGFKPQS